MESGTIEQTLPGLGPRSCRPSEPQPGQAIGLSPAQAPGRRLRQLPPRAGGEDRRAPRRRAGERELKTFADGETYCRYDESIRGADMFIVQTAASPSPSTSWSSCHGQRGEARVREADHRGDPLVLLRAPGQEVAAPRADHRPHGRRRPRDGRRRPRDHDGPPRRPGAGLLPHPGRPHGRGADVRAVRPRPPRPGRRARRGRAGHRARQARGQVRGDDRRRPRRPQQGAPGPQPGAGDRRHRRRRGQGRRDDRRHHRHGGHALAGAEALKEAGATRSTRARRTRCSTSRRSSGSGKARSSA